MSLKGFFAKESDLNLEDYIIETFLIETDIDPNDAAAELAKEHSTALWGRVNLNEDFRPRHGAKVIDLTIIDKDQKPKLILPSTKNSKFKTIRIRVAHPHINFGPKIPNILTAVAGEGVFYSKGINAIKLLDLVFPSNFQTKFEGPKFGLNGIRKILQIYDRPIFCGVVKPNIGLEPDQFAELAYLGLKGGLDIVKDDEMLADVEYSPVKKRVQAVMQKLYKAEDETGEKKMYLVNITDEVDRIITLHDIIVENGANSVMLNSMTVGLSACRMLRKHTKVPLFSHFDFIAPFTRVPYFGISTKVVTKLERLVGFDAVIKPGFGERMITTDQEVLDNIDECLKEISSIKRVLPLPGGSDWAGSVPEMYRKIGSIDFGMVPGRGVYAHPSGPEAGARSLRQAWDAVKKNVNLANYGKTHPELREALNYFS